MRRPVFIIVAMLFLLTSIVVLYRIIWLGYPVLPVAKGQTWQLIINVYLTPQNNEESVLSLALPPEYTGNMVVEERVLSGMYVFNLQKQEPNRIGIWSGADIKEPEEITYRAIIHTRPRRGVVNQSPLLVPYPPAISREEQKLMEGMARKWQTRAPMARLQAVSSMLKGDQGDSPSIDAVSRQWRLVQQQHDRTGAALALLRATDLPARPVEGLRLTEGVQTSPTRWIEVWTGRNWSNLNPETGEVYPASAALLPLAVGGLPAVRATGVEVSDVRWNINRQVVSQWKLLYENITRSVHFLDRWSLLQLPPEFQGTFRILLLVPIGALIISILRTVVGLPTFGIFMPLLIALAFRSTGTLYGVTIFCSVLLVGYVVRSFLDKLHLLLVPRLSVILTLVVACFTVLALVGNKLGLREFMAVGLIPFVILTMTIERFFIIIEESGTREAVLTAAGSIAVSVIAFGIISWEPLQLTFFVYPELMLSVAALQILVGRYTGYRLSELFRFRSLRGPDMILDGFRRLREVGVLGMNVRNADYIMAYNARSAYPLVDDKVQTKRLAEKFGIPIPELYAVVENHGSISGLSKMLEDRREFVVKPARGSGGSGIILIKDRSEEGFITQSGKVMSIDDFNYHIASILSGIYSLGGMEDMAIIEALIHPDSIFKSVTYREGVPDERIIVYRGVPVMAMVRLPTEASDGKANLHQGAIGVGIDLGSGITLTAVHGSRIISKHPDTQNPVSGILLPHWDKLLLMAAEAMEMTGLGYLGADFILDRDRGPVLLELNARPGLAIQMANQSGLRLRLDKTSRASPAVFLSPVSRVAWAKENFGQGPNSIVSSAGGASPQYSA